MFQAKYQWSVWSMGKKQPQFGDKEDDELHAIVKNDKGGILSNLSTRKDNSKKLPKI